MDPTFDRRRALALLGGAGLAALAGCSGDGDDGASATTTTSSSTTTSAPPTSTTGATAGSEPIPEETAGPFPGDGSNGPNVLAEDGVVRSDITTSFGSMSGTAEGVPLVMELSVTDAASGTALAGAAVYAWQCDRDGGYSLYSDGVTDQNYLRGVQAAGADGRLSFTSVFPGCYPGRWPHVHFEVYESVDAATAGAAPIATSQLAFPQDACEEAYAAEGYETSARNLAQLSLERDGVFRDGVDQQLATMTGSTTEGWTAALAVPV